MPHEHDGAARARPSLLGPAFATAATPGFISSSPRVPPHGTSLLHPSPALPGAVPHVSRHHHRHRHHHSHHSHHSQSRSPHTSVLGSPPLAPSAPAGATVAPTTPVVDTTVCLVSNGDDDGLSSGSASGSSSAATPPLPALPLSPPCVSRTPRCGLPRTRGLDGVSPLPRSDRLAATPVRGVDEPDALQMDTEDVDAPHAAHAAPAPTPAPAPAPARSRPARMRVFFDLLSPVFDRVSRATSTSSSSTSTRSSKAPAAPEPVPVPEPVVVPVAPEPCHGSETSLGGAGGEGTDAPGQTPLRALAASPLGGEVECVEKEYSEDGEGNDEEDDEDDEEEGEEEDEDNDRMGTDRDTSASGSSAEAEVAAAAETGCVAETPVPAEEGGTAEEGEVPVYEDTCDPFFFIRRVHQIVACTPAERLGDVFEFPRCLPVLPPKAAGAPRATLVLDLDETLVHCSMEPIVSPNLVFPVDWEGARYVIYAYTRPGLAEFLRAVGELFEVVLFTASMPVYAGRVCDLLDPAHTVIQHRLYRHACVHIDRNYLKDLRVLGRDLATTVIVDNSPQAFAFQYDNGIPILSYFDSQTDRELLKLLPLLRRLAAADDVRPILRNHYKLYRRIECPFPPP